jgi:hypothetical protein
MAPSRFYDGVVKFLIHSSCHWISDGRGVKELSVQPHGSTHGQISFSRIAVAKVTASSS